MASRSVRRVLTGVVAVVASAALFAGGWSLIAGLDSFQRSGPVPGSTSGPSEPAVLPPLPASGRPVQPVPDVRLDGFADPPPGRGLERYRGQQLDWRSCDPLDCADLLVPLDYQAPDEVAITIRVYRQRDRTGERALFVNFGGPGAPSGPSLPGFALPGLDRTQVLSWDVRGSGASTPVRCWDAAATDSYLGLDFSPDDEAESTALEQGGQRFGLACLERSGALLGHLSTVETARDLDLIRSALGLATIDYLGYSNGTLLGASYAQLFGDRVGSMVLDGATNMTDSPVSQVSGFETALDRLAAWCVSTRCLPARDNAIEPAVQDLLSQLDERPLRVGDRRLTQSLAVSGLVSTLYAGQAGWPTTVRALADGLRGDGAPLLALADDLNGRRSDGSYRSFAYTFPASVCADRPAESLREALDRSAAENRQAEVLGPFFGPDLLCSVWPVDPPPALPRLTAPQAPPLLVIGTTGDPATPYAWSEAAAAQLESAVLVTNDGDGHTSSRDERCVGDIVVPFLRDGVVPADGVRC